MKLLPSFDPTASSSGTIPVGIIDQNSKVVIYNESAVAIQLNFEDGSTDVLHAWEGNKWTLNYVTPEIGWSTLRNLVGAGQSPASAVDVVVYGPHEKVEGTFPCQLTRLVSQGNVQAGGTVSNIVNDNNVATTSVVEATQTGASGSNVQLDNSGNLTLRQYVSATLTTLLQTIAGAANNTSNVKLSDATHQCEVLGSLLVDATSTFTGDATFNGAGNGINVTTNANVYGNITAGGQVTAKVNASNNSAFRIIDSSGQYRNVLYTNATDYIVLAMALNGKIFFCDSSGANLASIDTSGNMRLLGTLTQNTTP